MANSRNSRPPRRRPERSAPRKSNSAPQQRAARKAPQQRTPRKNPPPVRRRRSGTVLRVLTMLVIVAVFLFGLSIFFKVTEIQVTGNSMYTSEQVVEASAIRTGDNMMTLRASSAAGKIIAMLPYVEEVQIERILPGTVVIHIHESDAVYQVAADDGTSWLMNGSGKLLEQADVSAGNYPKLTGVTAQSPEAGAQIVCEETDALNAAMMIMELLESTDYISQIAEINVEKPYDIVVWYGSQFEIHLGGTDQMEYKMQYLTAILEDPQVESGGVIDLTLEENNVAVFKPWSSSQNLTEESTENSEETDDNS